MVAVKTTAAAVNAVITTQRRSGMARRRPKADEKATATCPLGNTLVEISQCSNSQTFIVRQMLVACGRSWFGNATRGDTVGKNESNAYARNVPAKSVVEKR